MSALWLHNGERTSARTQRGDHDGEVRGPSTNREHEYAEHEYAKQVPISRHIPVEHVPYRGHGRETGPGTLVCQPVVREA